MLETHTQGWKFDWDPLLREKFHCVVYSLPHRAQHPMTSSQHTTLLTVYEERTMEEFEFSDLLCT